MPAASAAEARTASTVRRCMVGLSLDSEVIVDASPTPSMRRSDERRAGKTAGALAAGGSRVAGERAAGETFAHLQLARRGAPGGVDDDDAVAAGDGAPPEALVGGGAAEVLAVDEPRQRAATAHLGL